MEVDVENKDANTDRTWLGSSLADLCKGKGPWSFSISPVNASKYHTVLYELPVTLKEPPKPHVSSQPQQQDDNDFVQMPHSEKNLFSVKEDGKNVIKLRWHVINENLLKPINNSKDLEAAINSYNSPQLKFSALHHFFQEVLSQQKNESFFEELLPKMINLALQLPDVIPANFPILKQNHNRSVSMSQLQAACLLANAFFCTFPTRKGTRSHCPGINFMRLFAATRRPKRTSAVMEKLKCLIHYFHRVTASCPIGVITFERRFIHRSAMPRWDNLENVLGKTEVHINSAGTIEDDGIGCLQVDFAHKMIGGGVLEYGCVQEEIRFVICPELIVSRLFVEILGDQEAVIITGSERYSNYSGYGDQFKWDSNFADSTPYDEYGRRRTLVCVIDAIRFKRTSDQFYPSAMLRELNKAYVGFSSNIKGKLAPVATGNWGCGVYKGLSTLKSLLQLMACNTVERDMVYYTFGNEKLRDDFYNMYIFLCKNNVTITELWRILCRFSTSGTSEEDLYSFIQKAYIDSKKQPNIANFFGKLEKTKEQPSTSSPYKYNMKNSTSPNAVLCKSIKSSNNSSSKGMSNTLVKYSETEIEAKKDDETCSVSVVEKRSIGDCDTKIDDDIIEATPPLDELKFNKKVKAKSKFTEEEIKEKLPKTDIVSLIENMDGASRKCNKVESDSFLSQIDKLPRKTKVMKVEDRYQQISALNDDEKMDVGITDNSSSQSQEESKAAKRKISDYFQPKSKAN